MNRSDYTPLRYQIYEKIREKIIYKAWESGTILSEGELAKSFGTSRTPIREAIRQLETEGLVRVIPKKGILIPKIKKKDIEDISELMEIIHCHAITEVAKKVTSRDIERLEKFITEADSCIGNEKKMKKMISLGIQFNELLLKISGNRKFLEIDKQMRAHLIRFTRELYDDNERRRMGWKLRKEIVGALKKEDRKLAELKMREYYQGGKTFLLDIKVQHTEDEAL